MHLSDSDICNLPIEIKKALEACSHCFIEADLGLAKEAMKFAAKKKSEWIAANLSGVGASSLPVRYIEDLKACLKELSSPFAVDTILPMDVANYIKYKSDSSSNLGRQNFLDQQIYLHTKHKVSFLEDLLHQLELYYGLDMDLREQLDFYHATHDLIASGRLVTDDKIKASYLNEDLPAPELWSENSLPAIKKYYHKMMTARETKMANSLSPHLEAGNIFIAVGCLHLPGIVRNLQAEGYCVNPVSLGKRIYPVSCTVSEIPWVACERGDLTTICAILTQNPEVIDQTRSGATLFHSACKAGHLNIAYLLLAFKPNILDLPNIDNHTALHVASKNGNLAMVHALIRMGADINCRDQGSGNTPLHLACMKGCENVVVALLEHGAQFLENSKKHTPLNSARALGHTNIAIIILEHLRKLMNAENKNTSSLSFSSLISQVGSPVYTSVVQDDPTIDEEVRSFAYNTSMCLDDLD
jgi:ankyrin repeat protein